MIATVSCQEVRDLGHPCPAMPHHHAVKHVLSTSGAVSRYAAKRRVVDAPRPSEVAPAERMAITQAAFRARQARQRVDHITRADDARHAARVAMRAALDAKHEAANARIEARLSALSHRLLRSENAPPPRLRHVLTVTMPQGPTAAGQIAA